jgi:hypothetical protein
MGPPGSGKSEQIINIAKFVYPKPFYIIDLEDKMQAMLESRDDTPNNIKLYKCLSWDEKIETCNGYIKGGLEPISYEILKIVKPGEWITIDRMDLSWPMVQDWFSIGKYKESLSDLLMDKSKQMTKKSMFTPRFDKGDWPTVNSTYDEVVKNLIYRPDCNVVMTAGIKAREDDSPLDIGRLGVLPRGQKELGHQPHSMFLLFLKRNETGNGTTFRITTDKDLKNRPYFENEEIMDFGLQYLSLYHKE